MAFVDAADPPQLLGRGLVVEMADEGVAGVGRDRGDPAGVQDLRRLLEKPLLATTLIAPDEAEPMNDPERIRGRFEKVVQAIVDAGACPAQPTTVVDLSGPAPVLGLARRSSVDCIVMTRSLVKSPSTAPGIRPVEMSK